MKIRNGFVSNSSSSSFVIYKQNLTEEQIEKIMNVSEICLSMTSQDTQDETFWGWDSDPWRLVETELTVEGSTWMDNFSMYDYLIKFVGVNPDKIKWDY